jgi:hypothetical protein
MSATSCPVHSISRLHSSVSLSRSSYLNIHPESTKTDIFDMSGTYHIVPRESEDSDVSPLLAATPISVVERQPVPASTFSFTSSGIVASLRVLTTGLAITAFVFWAIAGQRNFIAPLIFDMFMYVSKLRTRDSMRDFSCLATHT